MALGRAKREKQIMNTREYLGVFIIAAVVTSCSVRPAPTVMQRDYETDSTTRRVCAGYDHYYVLRFQEPLDSAKQRLLDSIQAQCPHYQILQEGTDSEPKIVGKPVGRGRAASYPAPPAQIRT